MNCGAVNNIQKRTIHFFCLVFLQHKYHSCLGKQFKAIGSPLGIVQILSLLAKDKHNNEFCFHNPNLVSKINKRKLKLLKIIYSASVNVNVLSDRDLVNNSLHYYHIRAAIFPRKIPCQTS